MWQCQGYIWAEHLDSILFAVRANSSMKLADIAVTTRAHFTPLQALRGKPLRLQITFGVNPMLPPAAAQETFIREAASHNSLTRASSHPQKVVPPADCSGTKLDCISASSVEATLMCDWDLIYFSPSLGFFAHCCQETIYSDYFKDIVNICCCICIKQEALVPRTEVRLLLVLAA